MKKTLLSLFFLSSLGLSAQTTIFEDDFEDYPDFAIANIAWTLIDVDLYGTYGIGTAPNNTTFPGNFGPRSFIVLNPSETTPPLTGNVSASSNWTARSGAKHMVCFAAAPTPPSTVPVVNNDWMISPQITLGSTGNVVSFWAKPTNSQYGLERFKVGISTGNTTSNVTLLNTGNFVTTPANVNWVQYSYNIPASFNGQAVYISINCVSNDQFGFAVDDFLVTTTGQMSTEDFFSKNFSMYPNPANGIVTLSAKNNTAINSVQITDLNGRIVKNSNTNVISEAQINVSDLNTGMYFVTVKTDAGSGTTKLMKN